VPAWLRVSPRDSQPGGSLVPAVQKEQEPGAPAPIVVTRLQAAVTGCSRPSRSMSL